MWQNSKGSYYAANQDGEIAKDGRLIGTSKTGVSGIDAARLGDAHWAKDSRYCEKLGKVVGKTLKLTLPALNGGVWCIFPGEQTDLTLGK